MKASEVLSKEVVLTDVNGTAFGLKTIEGKPRVSSTPYSYDIAEGNVLNHKEWSKLGYNAGVGATAEDLIVLSGAYVFPTDNTAMTVESSDNTQDKTGGTGALKVKITYLDKLYAENTVEVTLNGTTAVAIESSAGVNANIFRINSFKITSVGTGGVSVGNLSIKAGGVTYGYIIAGQTYSRDFIYTVPAGKALFITSFTLGSTSATAQKNCRFTLRANYDHDLETVSAVNLFYPLFEATLTDQTMQRSLEIPIKIPATVTLRMSVMGDGTIATGSARGWIESV